VIAEPDAEIGATAMKLSCSISVVLAVALASLHIQVPPKAKTDDDPAREAAARDAAVLETVLLDLLNHPESPVEDFSFEPKRRPRERVYFAMGPLTSRNHATAVLPQGDQKKLDLLSREQLAAAQEAAKNLAQRAEKNDAFKPFVPKDKRIAIYSKEQAERDDKRGDFAARPQVFGAFSPGYSENGQIAVVHLGFTWSGGFHGAIGAYVLAKQKGEWIVVVRDFTLFV
jgi:hypothetical protein